MSIIHKAPTAFSDTSLPLLTRDPLIRNGALFRLDFTNAYTLNGLAAGQGLADGTILKNMVDGSVDMTVAAGGALIVEQVAAGGLGITNTGTTSTNAANAIAFPNGAFDMHEAGDHNFIAHLWVKQAAAGNLTSANLFGARSGTTGGFADVASPLFGSTAAPVMILTDGVDASKASAFSRTNGSGNAIATAANGFNTGATLLSFAWTAAATSFFRNGVLLGTAATGGVLVPSPRSHATITAAAQLAAGDTVTVNGTAITFVANGAAGAQVNLGADAPGTLANLRDYINANKVTLNARAENTTGQPTTVLSIFHTGSAVLTLAKAAANLTLSAITNPYGVRLVPRAIQGTFYAASMNDLTVAGRTAAADAAAEYAGFKARLQTLGVAVS